MENALEFTAAYSALLAHYSLRANHTNPSSPNENGDIEQAHRRFKSAVRQALILRGSCDFRSRSTYAAFLSAVLEKRNRRPSHKLIEELSVMRPLPASRLSDSTALKVRVLRNSTVWVKNNLYSVPSQLIGEWVRIEVFAERLEVWYGDTLIEQIERVRGHRASRINYRHIIHSLLSKPGAFERFRHRQQLFPRFIFRLAYDRLRETVSSKASKEYLQILEMAVLLGEELVAGCLREFFETGATLSAESVFAHCQGERTLLSEPNRLLAPIAVELSAYDRLLVESGIEEALGR